MSRSNERKKLRMARQKKRTEILTPALRKHYSEDTCNSYIIHGGDLDTISKYPQLGPMKRMLRATGQSDLIGKIRTKLEKENSAPVAFKTLKRMASEFKRRTMKRVEKKAVQ